MFAEKCPQSNVGKMSTLKCWKNVLTQLFVSFAFTPFLMKISKQKPSIDAANNNETENITSALYLWVLENNGKTKNRYERAAFVMSSGRAL